MRPTWIWLGGFRSDMESTKATALDAYFAERGNALVRFDYSGHGRSGGEFRDGTISRWLEESMAVIDRSTRGPIGLIGSSMGGYLALLAARALNASSGASRLAGLVLIAPAVDMTEKLMWKSFPEEARAAIVSQGEWRAPSAYSAEPYVFTRALIEDGRRHLLLEGEIRTFCPCIVLQGARDSDVPLDHVFEVVRAMTRDPVTLTIVPDGDHRLSRPQDLSAICDAVTRLDSSWSADRSR